MVFGEGPQKLTPVDVKDVYPVSDPNFGRGGYGLLFHNRGLLPTSPNFGNGQDA